jgi:predicted transcriptional regulator
MKRCPRCGFVRGAMGPAEKVVVGALAERGVLGTSTLAGLLGASPSGATRILRNMWRDGLIVRWRREGNPRGGWEWTWKQPSGVDVGMETARVLKAAAAQYHSHLAYEEYKTARLLKEAIEALGGSVEE